MNDDDHMVPYMNRPDVGDAQRAFLGDSQLKSDQSFIDRGWKSYEDTTHGCPTTQHEWSQIKSSLLVQRIASDDATHTALADFLKQQILYKFCNEFVRLSGSLNLSFNNMFTHYMNLVPASQQKDPVDNYPVSQPKAWLGQDALGNLVIDYVGASNNFFVLYDFMKWLWIQIIRGTIGADIVNSPQAQANPINIEIFFSLAGIIDTFQQKILFFQDMLRGHREDTKPPVYGAPETSDQTGISRIKRDDLIRTVKNREGYPTQPWLHPGLEQCKIPYLGGYGRYIREERAKAEPSYYSDIQCGISGSTQFMSFMYLMAVSINSFGLQDVNAQTRRNSQRQILSAFMILCGDGGHNGREVVYGIIATYIVLNTFLNEVKKEMENTHIIMNRFQDVNAEGDRLNDAGDPLTLLEAYNYINNELATGQVTTQDFFNSLVAAGNVLGRDSVFIRSGLNYLAKVKEQAQAYNIAIDETRCIMYFLRICTQLFPVVSDMYEYTNDINITGITAAEFPQEYKNNKEIFTNWMTNILCLSNAEIANQGGVGDIIHGIDRTNGTMYNKDNNYTDVQLFYALDNNRCDLDPGVSFERQGDITLSDCVEEALPNGGNFLDNLDTYMQDQFNDCNQRYLDDEIEKAYDYPAEGVPFAFE